MEFRHQYAHAREARFYIYSFDYTQKNTYHNLFNPYSFKLFLANEYNVTLSFKI